jgi:hypothetical protein
MANQKFTRKSSNQISLKILGILIICLILLSSKCLAEKRSIIPLLGDLAPIVPWTENPTSSTSSSESELTSILIRVLKAFGIFCIDFIVNAFILIISYLILKQKELIRSWKFLKYIFFVTIGGALIDLIFVGGAYLSRVKGPLYPDMKLINIVLWGSVFLTFLGLAFYNYWLSRRLFNLNRKQAIFIGLIMGIFTNPLAIRFIQLISGLEFLLD